MGVSREVFYKVGGFSGMQVAEDIDLSMRLHEAGYKTALIPDAYVFHKRKSNFKKFYKQLFMHGKGRIDLFLRHKQALKLVHLFPTFFAIYLVCSLLSLFINLHLFLLMIIPGLTYLTALLIHASIQNNNIYIGILSMCASFIMLWSYGTGLLNNFIKRIIFKTGKDSEKSIILKN